MRQKHLENPMHKIQRWTGTYFQSAELWEVGTYLLVPHRSGIPLCEGLEFQKKYLEGCEETKDQKEQIDLKCMKSTVADAASAPCPPERWEDDPMESAPGNIPMPDPNDEILQDKAFEKYLENLRNKGSRYAKDDDADLPNGFTEPNDSTELADADAEMDMALEYLQTPYISFSAAGSMSDGHVPIPTDASTPIPRSDALNNSYVRVVHTNGIHHLAMVCCRCRGPDDVPLDLVAC